MAFIKVPVDFFERDKRLRKLIAKLGARASALPMRLWCYTGSIDARDGTLEEHSPEMLETALGWSGRDGKLEDSLIEAGFLRKIENGYEILNWEADQGHIWRWHEKAKKAGKASQKRVIVEAQSPALSSA